MDLSTEEMIVRRINLELLPQLRPLLSSLGGLGDEWTANNVMEAVAMAEAQVSVAEGQIATYGGYDTNVLRYWNAIFTALRTFLMTPIPVTLANGQTISITPLTLVLKYYAPAQV